MSVTLTPEAEAMIRDKIAAGPYRTSGEVIAEALRLLDVRERRVQQIRDSVADGFAAIERGEGIELTAELMEERGRRAEEQARRGECSEREVHT